MVPWQAVLTGLFVGYVCGSFPTGFIAAKLKKGVDIRLIGSGATGATNISRLLGKKLAVLVGIIDVAKSFLAISIALWLLRSPWMVLASAWGACLGHVFPVWLGFKGGKAVSTTAGALLPLLGLMWLPTLLLWLTSFWLYARWWRVEKMAKTSLTVALWLIFALWFSHRHSSNPWHYLGLGIILAATIFFAHRKNMGRIWRNEDIHGNS